jgi:hypothetical protein
MKHLPKMFLGFMRICKYMQISEAHQNPGRNQHDFLKSFISRQQTRILHHPQADFALKHYKQGEQTPKQSIAEPSYYLQNLFSCEKMELLSFK